MQSLQSLDDDDSREPRLMVPPEPDVDDPERVPDTDDETLLPPLDVDPPLVRRLDVETLLPPLDDELDDDELPDVVRLDVRRVDVDVTRVEVDDDEDDVPEEPPGVRIRTSVRPEPPVSRLESVLTRVLVLVPPLDPRSIREL